MIEPAETSPFDQFANSFLYCLNLAYDGNFKSNRKDKPVDPWDTCLSDGRKYFVSQEQFNAFINKVVSSATASKIKVCSTRLLHAWLIVRQDSGCNNHKAVANNWVQYEGLAETGIGATICARHSFFMPVGTVRLTRGEK